MTFPPTGTLHLTMIFPRWEWEDCKSIAELLVTITKRATLGSIFEVMFKSQLTTVNPNVPSIGRWLFLASSYGLVGSLLFSTCRDAGLGFVIFWSAWIFLWENWLNVTDSFCVHTLLLPLTNWTNWDIVADIVLSKHLKTNLLLFISI